MPPSEPRYPDKPPNASDGSAFERLCCAIWFECFGERLTRCLTREAQFLIGDTEEGIEFKELRKSVDRLHIEFAERTAVTRPWVESGILRRHRASKYMCGNDLDVFLFKRSDLIDWGRRNDPRIVFYGWNPLTGRGEFDNPDVATIRSYVLEKVDAAKICLHRFERRGDGRWWVTPPLKPVPSPSLITYARFIRWGSDHLDRRSLRRYRPTQLEYVGIQLERARDAFKAKPVDLSQVLAIETALRVIMEGASLRRAEQDDVRRRLAEVERVFQERFNDR